MTYGSTTAEKKRHLLRTSTTPMGVKQEFTYGDFGNTVMSKTVNGTTSAIGSKTEYDEKQNYPVKSYDARGNAVTRSINPNDYTLTRLNCSRPQASAAARPITVSVLFRHSMRRIMTFACSSRAVISPSGCCASLSAAMQLPPVR